MKADIARFWLSFRIPIMFALFAGVLSVLGVGFLVDGLTATRDAEKLRDFGVVANVTDVRIHVSARQRSGATSDSDSGSSTSRSDGRRGYSVDDVEVVFTGPQGQERSESLSRFVINGNTPKSPGWTTQFEGQDRFLGKEVIYLPNQPGQGQMHDQVQSTLDHGFDPIPTFMGIGAIVLALFGWYVLAMVVIGMVRAAKRGTAA